MNKILFTPFSLVSGLVAGVLSKKLFETTWKLLAREEPPDPDQRDVPWTKLLAVLLLQGAVFRAVRGVADRAARKAFSKLTGSWPGEQRPKPA